MNRRSITSTLNRLKCSTQSTSSRISHHQHSQLPTLLKAAVYTSSKTNALSQSQSQSQSQSKSAIQTQSQSKSQLHTNNISKPFGPFGPLFHDNEDNKYFTILEQKRRLSNEQHQLRDRAFIEFDREADRYRDPHSRINDFNEINQPTSSRSNEERQIQAARCMDCGTPFCQSYTGCPLNNLIPEWNDLVYKNDMQAALDRLHLTNNFPEFTGRVCPAPCEGACVAGVISSPVTIKNIEYSIVDYGFKNDLIKPRIVSESIKNGINIAIIGSGPAGLACADILNQKGYNVYVYEREDKVGGLLTYGIPNMKLDKATVERRVDLLSREGVNFICNKQINDINRDIDIDYDACVLAIGSTIPRDLPVNLPGRSLNGIHFAMEFLTQNQKKLFTSKYGTLHSVYDSNSFIDANNKNVVVIGGGDTGNDCIGTSMRQQCKSITNLELMNKPPNKRNIYINPWPEYPRTYWMDYGHEEVECIFGYDPRHYSVTVKEFIGDENNNVKAIKTVNVKIDEKKNIHLIPNTEKIIECDLVLLSMGFISPEMIILDNNNPNIQFKGNSRNNDYTTNVENVFTCGDARRGQSLVVWAIAEGRGAANAVDQYFVKNGLIAV